ncbi:hypothetical protein [Yinghuangia seranimata]|uniref:hypothetical protein n=1 Tax=Yinghuangia seranimata TaxID=408067 RepID=UPI00248C2583|nr:hypothetical protein [Yinghuangia seranimata]MDI2129136.1 hypothetical protein [Yinghuangia seranimata]
MGQTRYFPVFESDDLGAAHDAAQRLLALADTGDVHTTLWADAPERPVLDGLLGILSEPDTPVTISQCGEGTARPGWWELEAMYWSKQGVEAPFLDAAGHLIAAVGWEVAWPEVPELGLPRRDEYSEVQLMLNCAGIYRSQPAVGHRVYVHVKWSIAEGDRRAEWLAEQAGLRMLGPGEIGW